MTSKPPVSIRPLDPADRAERARMRSLLGPGDHELEISAHFDGAPPADALIENDVSLAAHRAPGFDDIDRVVCFARKL